ncbi:lysophospholipid acyltransferase family protein [Desulfonatronospira sp.]|uniref:lysophospholipid acyltransferase family protein n=1 Tax=Desulfonatronospira sp. TaxID=1962951 RepID=UPI0025C643BE|nr:lysophospholipid acyltransferase family protein [Desulfonatronospira sp.]
MKSITKRLKKAAKRTSYPITAWLFVLMGHLLRKMSREQTLKLGRLLGYLACDGLRIRRNLVINNLKQAFPEKTETEIQQVARQTYVNQAVNVLELLRIPLIRDEQDARELLDIHADEVVSNTLAQNRGAVVVSAHLSSWETIGVCAGLLMRPFHLIVKPLKNKRLDKTLNHLRTLHGNRTILKERALREGLKALKSGGVLVILGDQAKRKTGVSINFLGRQASVSLGPAFLALKAGVPLFVEKCRMLENGKYLLEIKEIQTSDLACTREDIRTLTIRYTRALENFISTYPQEWLWLHDRWKPAKLSRRESYKVDSLKDS